jgi:hypothetical protein
MSSRFWEALEARQDALNFVNGSRFDNYMDQLAHGLLNEPQEFSWLKVAQPRETLMRFRVACQGGLTHGPTFWWSPDMCEALDVLRQSFPDNPLDLSELVSMHGFFYYSKPIRLGKSDKTIVATSWCVMAEDDGPSRHGYSTGDEATGVVVVHYSRPPLGWIVPVTMSPWNTGNTAAQHYVETAQIQGATTAQMIAAGIYTGMELLQLFMTAQVFVQQRVASTTRSELPRASARRRERERSKPTESDIQVVQLRRRENQTTHASDGVPRSVDWNNRWWVGLSTAGFWRNQPTRDGIRRILIEPYVKGPEDKPLVTRGAVNVVVR